MAIRAITASYPMLAAVLCLGGGTGRRKGLKIPYSLWVCGFDSRPRYQFTGKASFIIASNAISAPRLQHLGDIGGLIPSAISAAGQVNHDFLGQ
jgi:hypothetical protein